MLDGLDVVLKAASLVLQLSNLPLQFLVGKYWDVYTNFTVKNEIELVAFGAMLKDFLAFFEGLVRAGGDDIEDGLVVHLAVTEIVNFLEEGQ